MATIAEQFLYPPLLDTYMPAFLKDETCRIYFSITPFNNINDINHVQLTLRYVNNNMNALKNTVNAWPNEIKLCQIHTDNSVTTDYKYYVEINPATDLKDEIEFALKQYYKVQLRFSNAVVSFPPDPGATWYHDNIDKFSEWSRVCLIKGIPEPIISMKGLKETSILMASLYDALSLTSTVYDNKNLTALQFDNGNLLASVPGQFLGSDFGWSV